MPDERYSLPLKLFKLVQEHPPTERLIADALPVMHRLAHDTLQSCHMGVLEGSRVVIVAQVNPPANIGFYVKLGSTVDLMESASGYVILAHQAAQRRELTLAGWGARRHARNCRAIWKCTSRGYAKQASKGARAIW